MLNTTVLDAFTKKYAGSYHYTATVRHKGTVIAFAMDERRHIYYTVLDFNNPNGDRPNVTQGSGAQPSDGTLDVNAWQNLRELRFPSEIAEVGYGVADQKRLPVFKKNSRIAEKPDTPLPDENSDDAQAFDFFLSTTARLTAKVPFQVLSDEQYVYLFRQAIPALDDDMVFVNKEGYLACKDNAKNLFYTNAEGDAKAIDAATCVPIVDSTLLVDRFVLAGNRLQTKMEVRFQRSRSKTRPANRKDSLGAKDLDGNSFLEPTQELKFVNYLQDGRFTVLLLPTQVVEIERWQIFAYHAKTDLISSYNVERAKDGLFNTKGTQFYTSPDPKHQKDVFESKPGKDPFTGKALIPLVSEAGEAESAVAFNGIGDYVDLGAGVKLGRQFTLEAWIYPTRPHHAEPQPLITTQGSAASSRTNLNTGFSVWIEGQTRLRMGFGDGQRWHEWTTRNILTPNAWNHVAVTFDSTVANSTAVRVYIKGRLQEKIDRMQVYTSGTVGSTVAPQLESLAGRVPVDTAVKYFGFSSHSFSGKIDEIRLWRRVRSERELQSDRHQRLTGQELELAGYWRFDEARGNTVYDQTDAKINGTLYGGKWVTSDAPVGESMGVVRHSFQVASFTVGQPLELRGLHSGLTALLYYQQIPVASGYSGKEKPLKQNARVMLAMATKTSTGSKHEIATLDFGVSRAGKLAQVPDVVPLEVINPPNTQEKPLNEQLDIISDNQSRSRTLTEELVNLKAATDVLSPQVTFLSRVISNPNTMPEYFQISGLSLSFSSPIQAELDKLGFSQDLNLKIINLVLAALMKQLSQAILNQLDAASLTVYTEADYQGQSRSFKPGAFVDLKDDPNWNDKISSVKFPDSVNVGLGFLLIPVDSLKLTAYQNPDKTGKVETFTNNQPNLAGDWNDSISGLLVEMTTAATDAKKQFTDEIVKADKTIKDVVDAITPIRDSLQRQLDPLVSSQTAKQTELNNLKGTTNALLDNLRNGVSVPMKLLHTDAHGLTISGGVLGFAWTSSGPQYTPLLFDSATGNLALYFRGVNNQFFVAYYDTQTQRPQYPLLDETGREQVQCFALSAEQEMDNIVITVGDAVGNIAMGERQNYCTVTITGPTFEETWNRVPRQPEAWVKVLSGSAGERERIGFGSLTRNQGDLSISVPDKLNRALAQGTTLMVGKTQVTVKQTVPRDKTHSIPVTSESNSLPIGERLPLFFLPYDYAAQSQTTKIPSDLYNGSLLIGAGLTLVGRDQTTKIKNQRVASGTTLTSQWKANAPGRTLTFDGAKSYAKPVDTSQFQSFAAPHDLTLEAWVKPSTPFRQTARQETDRMIQQYVSNDSSYALGLQKLRPVLVLDGKDDFLRVPLNEPETEITHELWFKTSTADCGLFSVVAGTAGGNVDRNLYLSGGNIKARVWNNEIIASTNLNLSDDTWHHVAHVLGTISEQDGQKIVGQRLYVDGKEVAKGDKAASDFNDQDAILIGHCKDAESHPYFKGQIDEVRVWKRVRSLTEIQNDMHRRLTGTEADLLGYWYFDQVSGTTVKDYSPSNLSGTLNGAPQVIAFYALFAGVKTHFVQSSPIIPTNLWSHLSASFRQSWGLQFDGKGGYLDCGKEVTLDIRRDLTIEVCLKVAALGREMLILSKGQEAATYRLSMTAGGALKFGDAQSNQALQPGKFYKIAVTRKYETTTQNSGIESNAFVSTDLGIDPEKSELIRTVLRDKGYLAGRSFGTGYSITNKLSEQGLGDISDLKDKLKLSEADWNSKAQDYRRHIQNILSAGPVQTTTAAGITFYIDQKTAGGASLSGGEAPGNDAALTIGGFSTNPDTFNGVISEIRLWNVAVDKTVIGNEIKGDEKGLISWWRFEEKQGNTALDSKSQNHARIKNTLKWTAELDDPQSRLTLYCNGEALSVAPVDSSPNPFQTSTPQFTLGALAEGSTYKEYFQGEMEDVRIWKVVRTPEQIRDSLFRRLMSEWEDLIAYYTFDPEPDPEPEATSASSRAADQTATTVRVVDRALQGNHLNALDTSYILSTAPIGDDTPQVRSALAGIRTPFSGTIQSPPGVQEYGDMQYDSAGNLTGVLKRCYSFIKDNQWHLITGFKVGDLVAEWVGQVQFAPQLIGYIEGAPPVPSENLTSIAGRLADYARASSIELVQAESTTYSYAASKTGGFDMQMEFKLGFAEGIDVDTGVSVFGAQIDKLTLAYEVGLGVQGKFEHSTGWLSEATTGVGRTQIASSKLSLRGNAENPDSIAYPEVGRRFVPANVGLALVKSETADVFALRLKHNNALVSFQMRPNPDIPPDWNLITFPINPRYINQGSLDGKIGFQPDRNYPNALTYSPDSSYFKPIEAYTLKNRIDRETKENQTYYEGFDSVTRGSTVPTPGLQQPGEIQILKRRANPQDKPGARLPQFQKRNLVNTYVWTADGGLFAETQETMDVYQEKLGGTYAFKGLFGVYGEYKIKLGLPILFGPSISANALFGGRQNFSVTKSQEAKTSFSLRVDVDRVESDIFVRKANGDLEMDLSDPLNPRPKRQPGRVDAYRFMSFYLEPKSDYFETFFNQIIDPIWLEQSDAANAVALREARQDSKKPPCWRILHRVTYVSRILPTFSDNAPPSLEKTLQTLDINSNYELIKQLEPFVSTKLSSYPEFAAEIKKTIETYLPELQPYLVQIREYMSLYFGILDESTLSSATVELGQTPTARTFDQPPIVLAGNDQSNVGLDGASVTVQLEGNAIDDRIQKPEALFVTWEKVSGEGTVIFQDPHDLKTTATFTQRGKYLLRLTVHDGSLTASDEMTITVNQRPVVAAGADQSVKRSAETNLLEAKLAGLLIDSGLGDPDRGITVKWSQQSRRGKVTFADSTALTTTATFDQSGHYLLKLTVDNGSFTADDEVMIAVASRTTEQLQVLYTFKTTTGTTIPDVSGQDIPLDLEISDPMALTRTGNALTLHTPSLLSTAGAAARLTQAMKASNELTLEAWIQPSVLSHAGLARILTLTDGPGRHNFILGQSGSSYYAAIRTTIEHNGTQTTDTNASTRALIAGAVHTANSTHLVYTRRSTGEVQFYLNGQLVGSRIVDGDLSAWDESFKLMLGNEPGTLLNRDRAWLGSFHLVAIYSQALSSEEVQQNFQFGRDTNLPPIISAGFDQVIHWGNTQALPIVAQLEGRAIHDREPQQGSITWTQVAGPDTPNGVTLEAKQGDLLRSIAKLTQNGRYVIRLTVDDGELLSSDEVVIVANRPPLITAQAEPQVALTEHSVSQRLRGSIANTGLGDAGTVTTTWQRLSGSTNLHIDDSSQLETTVTFYNRGVYELELVANNGLFSERQSVTINVHQPPTVKPVAPQTVLLAAGPTPDTAQAEVTLTGEVQDQGLADESQAGLRFEWSKVSGPGEPVFATPAELSTTATFSKGGVYVLRLTALNRQLPSLSGSTDIEITVNQPPVVNAGADQTIQLPAKAELEAIVSDDGLPRVPGALSLEWEKVSGAGSVIFSTPYSSYTTAEFSQAGTYGLKLTVSDGAMGHGTVQVSHSVTITVKAPPRVSKDLLALYAFEEAGSPTIHAVAGESLTLALTDGATLAGGILTVHRPTQIESLESATGLIRRLKDRPVEEHAITIETWVKPSVVNQTSSAQPWPGRIVTLSAGAQHRNFTLEQGDGNYTVRLRTQSNDLNGSNNRLIAGTAVTERWTHLVYTWSARSGIARLYQDGVEVGRTAVAGDFSPWDDHYKLAIANELDNQSRPWLGEIHLLALYHTELTLEEVRGNFAAGAEAK